MLLSPIRVSSVITCSQNDKSMQLPLTIETSKQNIGTRALVDSGAEGIFISRKFARDNWIPTKPLGHRIIAKNVDDTVNKQGIIDRYADLEVEVGGRKQKEMFLVTDLGKSSVILGLPWLAKHNPTSSPTTILVKKINSPTKKGVHKQHNPPHYNTSTYLKCDECAIP